MSAINDLTGRCLDAFLMRSRAWYRQTLSNGSQQTTSNRQQSGVPVYSGKDAQERVQKTGVIRHLYDFRRQSIDGFDPKDLPELQ
jgi:hypothetical protein